MLFYCKLSTALPHFKCLSTAGHRVLDRVAYECPNSTGQYRLQQGTCLTGMHTNGDDEKASAFPHTNRRHGEWRRPSPSRVSVVDRHTIDGANGVDDCPVKWTSFTGAPFPGRSLNVLQPCPATFRWTLLPSRDHVSSDGLELVNALLRIVRISVIEKGATRTKSAFGL